MKNGFTLIELVIYFAIVAVILLVAVNFGFRIIENRTQIMAYREVQQNSRFAMDLVVKKIRSASWVREPAAGATSSSLILGMPDQSFNPTIFEVTDGVLQVTEGANGPFPITSDQVKISNFLLTNTSYAGTPGNIGIDITVEYNNKSGRPEYDAVLSLSSSASLREPGKAALLSVDTSVALINSDKLENIILTNVSGSSSITIDKISLSWSGSSNNLTEIKINGSRAWQGNEPPPAGELDIAPDAGISQGGAIPIDYFKFNSNINPGTGFSLQLIMIDGSTTDFQTFTAQ